MFRMKQIAMVATLGLVLVTATVFAATQSAQAWVFRPFCYYCNGVNPVGSTGGSTQNSQGQNDNSQSNGASGGPTGQLVKFHH